MKPPTQYLAVLETIREVRALLAEVPRMVRVGESVAACLAVDECRTQLQEMLSSITRALAISPGLESVLLQPPLTRPGGRPGEDPEDFSDQPLW